MQFSEAREAVYLRSGFATDDGQITPAVVNSCLRSALNFIASEHDWDWLQATETLTTTADQNYVTPGATWIRTITLTGPDGDSMVQAPWVEFRAGPTSSTGQPDRWSPRNGRLYLWPVPDTAYALTHDYIRSETDLTSDSSEPLMPDQFQDGWVEYATYLMFRRIADDVRAGEAYTAYQDWQRVTVDNRRRSRGPYKVSVRPGAWT